MALTTITLPDPHMHRASRSCVPCGRPGCNHCQHLHRETADECIDPSCACQEFSLGEDCDVCGGEGVIEEHHFLLGAREVVCPNEECVEGKVS